MTRMRILVSVILNVCGVAYADTQIRNTNNCPDNESLVSAKEIHRSLSTYCNMLPSDDRANIANSQILRKGADQCTVENAPAQQVNMSLCYSNSDQDDQPDYAINMLSNHDASSGMSGWRSPAQADGVPVGISSSTSNWSTANNKFASPKGWVTKEQVIDLYEFDFDRSTIDVLKPVINVRQDVYQIWCADNYFVTVQLLDEQKNVLESWSTGIKATSHQTCAYELKADRVSHRFENYPNGVRYIRWVDGAEDSEAWDGYYGAQFDSARLYVDPPNLLSNATLSSGTLDAWTVTSGGTSGAVISRTGGLDDHAAVILNSLFFERTQTVDLYSLGYNEELLSHTPKIVATELFREVYCADKYHLKVELLDSQYKVLSKQFSGMKTTGGECGYHDDHNWKNVTFIFDSYPSTVRYVRWTDGGRDSETWTGPYGTVMTRPTLSIFAKHPGHNERRAKILDSDTGGLNQPPIEKCIESTTVYWPANFCCIPEYTACERSRYYCHSGLEIVDGLCVNKLSSYQMKWSSASPINYAVLSDHGNQYKSTNSKEGRFSTRETLDNTAKMYMLSDAFALYDYAETDLSSYKKIPYSFLNNTFKVDDSKKDMAYLKSYLDNITQASEFFREHYQGRVNRVKVWAHYDGNGKYLYRPDKDVMPIDLNLTGKSIADSTRHEYGHRVQRVLSGSYKYLNDTTCTAHRPMFVTDANCAFIEGWAFFYGVITEKNYDGTFTMPSKSTYNFEKYATKVSNTNKTALRDEGRVAAALLDLWDNDNDPSPVNADYGNAAYKDQNAGVPIEKFFEAFKRLKQYDTATCKKVNSKHTCLNLYDYLRALNDVHPLNTKDINALKYNYVNFTPR